MKIFLVSFLIFFDILNLKAQKETPSEIIDHVRKSYERVRNFSAHAEIIVDVKSIKIPDKYATVYFKYPDKYRFKSKSFILVPRKGLNFSINEILQEPAILVSAGSNMIDGNKCYEIKIIPDNERSDIVLASLFIDSTSFLVRRMEVNTKKSGSYDVLLNYSRQDYPVPSRITITFDVDKLKFPLKFMGDIDTSSSPDTTQQEGKVIIKYSDYKINSGVPEDIFNDDTSPQKTGD